MHDSRMSRLVVKLYEEVDMYNCVSSAYCCKQMPKWDEIMDCNLWIPNPGIPAKFSNPIIPGLAASNPEISVLKGIVH